MFGSTICMYVASSICKAGSRHDCDDLLARLFVHASNVYILVSHRVGQRWTLLRRDTSSSINAAKREPQQKFSCAYVHHEDSILRALNCTSGIFRIIRKKDCYCLIVTLYLDNWIKR
jgi:hypothetical protein